MLVSTRGIVEFANAAAARILRAAAPQQLIGMDCEELLRPEGRSLECASTPLAEPGGAVTLTVFRDVTRDERLRDAAEASGEYVWEADAGWRYSYLSDKVEAVLGYSAAELLGRRPQDFMPLGEERAVEEWLSKHAPEGRGVPRARPPLGHQARRRHLAVGERGPGARRRRPLRRLSRHGGRRHAAQAGRGAHRIPRHARRAHRPAQPHAARRPRRTGAILQAARARSQLAALYIDLDRFKLVNESLGHQAGDALLRAVAERLEAAMAADTLARLSAATTSSCCRRCARPRRPRGSRSASSAVLARPFVLDGRTLNVGASIGISVYPERRRATSPSSSSNAEAAMYHAK